MTQSQPLVSPSPIDEARFGVRIARTAIISEKDLPEMLAYCRAEGVELLITRCDAADLATAQALEQAGFQLMDTLVYFRRNLADLPVQPILPGIAIRLIRMGEAEQVQAIASETFQGYGGHYHADPRLDRAQCDAVYPSWAYRSCVEPAVAKRVLVAESEAGLAGFAAIRLNTSDEGEVTLYGVLPAAQRRGIGPALLLNAMHWLAEQGASRFVISTQVTNYASQTVWVRLGLGPYQAFYTFHKWFTA
jgi:ribosomal protein S18 acetylase RimI-like enzyme